jgi:hypothetical protein
MSGRGAPLLGTLVVVVASGAWVALAGCHGKETDEVLAGLRADNERLRGEIAALRVENAVLVDDGGPKWAATVSLKRAGGGSGRVLYRRECPAGQALKGFATRSGSVIDALWPVCAPVAPPPGAKGTRALERELALVGGRGGRPGETICPGQALMTGVRGRAAEVVDAIEVVCEGGKRGGRIGGGGGREYERDCPVGWIAVGIIGRQGDYVESLSLTCADTGETRRAVVEDKEKPVEMRRAPVVRLEHELPEELPEVRRGHGEAEDGEP